MECKYNRSHPKHEPEAMTIVKREFVWNSHRERPTRIYADGWLLTSMPNFDPCHQDYVVMHDTFEHHPDDLPDIEHEMMAFGSLAFIRVKGMWDVFDTTWDAHRSLSEDVTHFLNEVKFVINECPDVKELHPELVEEFAAIRRKAGERFSEEYLPAVERALYWVSKGYARAKARWAGHSSADVCRLLETTLVELKTLTGRLVRWDYDTKIHPKHGSKLTITFDTVKLTSKIKYVRIPRNKYVFPVDMAA